MLMGKQTILEKLSKYANSKYIIVYTTSKALFIYTDQKADVLFIYRLIKVNMDELFKSKSLVQHKIYIQIHTHIFCKFLLKKKENEENLNKVDE